MSTKLLWSHYTELLLIKSMTELKKEHIGQIEVYMNYIDKTIRKINQDKTIGIIICRKDNKFIMEYCSDDRITSRTYELMEKELAFL